MTAFTKKAGFLIFLSLAIIALPTKSHAVSRNISTLMTTSLYGAAAGAGLGLISYPFTGDVKTIALGASVGLFLGIAVGIYHISNRDNPENPLRSELLPPVRKSEFTNFTSARLYATKAGAEFLLSPSSFVVVEQSPLKIAYSLYF